MLEEGRDGGRGRVRGGGDLMEGGCDAREGGDGEREDEGAAAIANGFMLEGRRSGERATALEAILQGPEIVGIAT